MTGLTRERCQSLRRAHLPPLDFSIGSGHQAPDAQAGRQAYAVCFPSDFGIPNGPSCAVTFLRREDGLGQSRVWLVGPSHASRRSVEVAARRLGLDGDTMRQIEDAAAAGEPVLVDEWERKLYGQCQNLPPSAQSVAPEFDLMGAFLAWGWVCGIYIVGQRMSGE